jgi:hypothetical protein
MAKTCGFCGEVLHWPAIYSCYYCQKVYCANHRLAENHECPKVMAAKHIEKDWLRKKGVNVTTGKYAVNCKQCGYSSEYHEIEEANQKRIDHIKGKGCPPNTVQLREREDDKAEDSKAAELRTEHKNNTDWMAECLNTAKTCIKTHHNFCKCDAETFFRTTTYGLYVQDDKPGAYAYINIIKGSGHFPIAVHPALSDDNPQNRRMLNVVLVHELLHALHQDWEEDKVRYTEKILANKCSHFDALQDLERLGFSGSMHF